MKKSDNHRKSVGDLNIFADQLLLVLPRFVRAMTRQGCAERVRNLITLPQMCILRQIADYDSCSMRDLAREQGLKASSITGLLDRLVALGMIKRCASQKDRREILASLTPKGRRTLQKFYLDRHQSITRLFEHVSENERKSYLKILNKIVQADKNSMQTKLDKKGEV